MRRGPLGLLFPPDPLACCDPHCPSSTAGGAESVAVYTVSAHPAQLLWGRQMPGTPGLLTCHRVGAWHLPPSCALNKRVPELTLGKERVISQDPRPELPRACQGSRDQKQKEQRSREGSTNPAAGSSPGNPLKKQGWASVRRTRLRPPKCCSAPSRLASSQPWAASRSPPRMKGNCLRPTLLSLLPIPALCRLQAGAAAPR